MSIFDALFPPRPKIDMTPVKVNHARIDVQAIVDILKEEEGYRSRVYLDSLGYPTIGYGTLVQKLPTTKLSG